MNQLEQLFTESKSPDTYARGFCSRLAVLLGQLDTKAVANFIGLVERAADDDKTIFLVANGGSAAVAGHCVNDLSANSVVEGKPGFRVMSLSDNPFSLTALANDVSFNEVFAVQLMASMRPGDLVVALSVSGNSPNVLRAVEYANAHGATTVGITGFDGGKLRPICQHSVHVPATKDEYGPVEDMFSVIMHIVAGYLTMKRGRMLCH